MNITITGKHIEITDAIRAFIEQKFAKIQQHFPQITSIAVTASLEKLLQRAEVTVNIPHHQVHAHSEHSDLYAAIDLLIDKVRAQLTKLKGKDHPH